ncbi:hypothetical protein IGI04_011769 [Brassica rapa subsp. trilocularis]|uniref:GOLD domain-containing protein n=1 Tax=Brassica rapa subsp. trilocularis TaxID=1813537 RepID=A0ABQ7N425_BRACM|nr:hypothetical protein IGI04_011769 [Brassica rapa subsp. trilocularis]
MSLRWTVMTQDVELWWLVMRSLESFRIRKMAAREAYMREVNDKTNKRVAQLSFMSLGLSITVSLFQVWHLKRFVLKKKLI